MNTILYLPERFDINEWFAISAAVFVLATAFLLPKRFSAVLTTTIVVFNVFLGQTVDYVIAVKPYDLYDTGDSSKYELLDIVTYLLCYPPMAYIYLYFYDRWGIKGAYRILYVIGFSILTVFLEYLAVKFHLFIYKGWKIVYSLFVYFGVYMLNILMFHATQYLLDKDREKKGY